ncbi:NAD-binding protein [Anaerocolumna sp. AGMB13025]|uniref:potassium channel family protein n=1 Tax=Anaerocolumna sp. AGMB13025 TaxID=3039116 RepID=UPI00241FF992|nr:NAD-binding protein [Anaerocolumna sp. AGMB13025]WFR60053.1 NAD-binding protein [Anaerocolumna sp. AGMB13025]
MSIFKKPNKERIIIVGCSSFGSALLEMFSEQNKSIIIIDKKESAFLKLSPNYKGFCMEGDATDIDMLDLAGANEADMLVAATNDDNSNIMIAQIAKQIFKIKKVIARINDTNKQSSYSNMDIITISPIILSLNEFKKIALDKE